MEKKYLKWSLGLNIVLIVALIWGFAATGAKMDSWQSELSALRGSINDLHYRVAGIGSVDDIRAELERQASLFSDYSVEYGEFDFQGIRQPVTVKVQPKELSPDAGITLYIGEKSWPMEKKGVGYEASAELSLSDSGAVSVEIRSGETVKSQSLNQTVFGTALMGQMIKADYHPGRVSFNVEKGILTMKGSVVTLVYGAESRIRPKGARVFAMCGADTLFEWDASEELISDQTEARSVTFDKSVELVPNRELRLYVDVLCAGGLTFRIQIGAVTVNGDGNVSDAIVTGANAELIDENGNSYPLPPW